MQLSKLEYRVLEELKKNNLLVFKIKDLCLLLSLSKTKAYNLIKALKKKEAIKKTVKSYFTLREANEFLIGQTLNFPSYLSFWSALNYYGFSDQNPQKIFFATTKYTKSNTFFQYITLAKNKFFGYKAIGEITIAEKEKAFLDSLLFPKYAGGIKEIKKALQSGLSELDKQKLFQYAFKIKNKVILRRLGFLLEELGYTKDLGKLHQKIGSIGYELLDPTLNRKNNFNKKWLLDVNI
ncbi:hypothetical protein HYU21_03040 [Candidatus Woesearchaeota archaeon]|nr:hypothetical protein [Candidatus Woesearchaeota archaeon]